MRVKICGLSSKDTLEAAVKAGAAYVGFVFFEKSPRNVDIPTARELSARVDAGVCKVALTVNAKDEELDAILGSVGIDMIQLHGSESPDRVSDIKDRFGLPVMKAIGVATENDLPSIQLYAQVADQLLIDAKPAPTDDLPGGNGLAFDWRLIAGRRWAVPWMLAGGLDPKNVSEAIKLTGARQVDVSSGVEMLPGQKDSQKIADFIRAAGAA